MLHRVHAFSVLFLLFFLSFSIFPPLTSLYIPQPQCLVSESIVIYWITVCRVLLYELNKPSMHKKWRTLAVSLFISHLFKQYQAQLVNVDKWKHMCTGTCHSDKSVFSFLSTEWSIWMLHKRQYFSLNHIPVQHLCKYRIILLYICTKAYKYEILLYIILARHHHICYSRSPFNLH